MPHEHKFRAYTVWTGAAAGPTTNYQTYSREHTVAIDGKPTMTLSAAPAFRGSEALENPEDLLLAALSGCHLLSFLAVCVRLGIEVVAYTDECTATMAFQEGKMRFIETTLRPKVTVARAEDVERAQAAHERAAAECFIANSVRFPVHHEPETVAQD
jgi:organic hydroperoxide reductase OsmC/OhrA